MLTSLFKKIVGSKHDRDIRRMQPIISRIAEIEQNIDALSDDALKGRTAELKQRHANGESLDALLPDAFATVRVASKRVLGMRHYDVQLIGGIGLHRGMIAEMKTGEGKTLTATLALYLNALSGKGAHLVTVNDYLARRDAEEMSKIYGFLGMTTGVIVPNLEDAERRKAYACDITYGTNNEFGFDYLRDNMKFKLEDRVQRGLNFGIVDEVDSILIDEARTPLIISGSAELNIDIYHRINAVIVGLRRDEDYVVDEEHRAVTLTDEGVDKVESKLQIRNLFDPENIELVHHVIKALESHTLYKRDEHYVVEGGKIVIVDEFTGRKLAGRRWSDGLHQAVEAKEGVQIQRESVTLATITFQNFFRMYGKLAGMTGTADTEAEEFQRIYKLGVLCIPTNRKACRLDQGDLVYRTEKEKFGAIVDQILASNAKGQPVLVGTVSVEKSEVISKVLTKKGIAHEVLNAKQHDREAIIIAQAGRKGAVTISTNMAGRGTDILLGGNADVMAKQTHIDETSEEHKAALAEFRATFAKEREAVIAAGGLFILGTERHESRRIDNQLRGRAGRQGDPGESRFFLSLEDDLMRRFGADRIQGLLQRLGMEEGVPIESPMVSRSIENAQKRVEGRNFDIRKSLLEYDDVMDVQRKAIYRLRGQILLGDQTEALVLDLLEDTVVGVLDQYASAEVRIDEWDFEALARDVHDVFEVELDVASLPRKRELLETLVWKRVHARFENKIAEVEPVAAQLAASGGGETPKTAKELFLDIARESYLRELDRAWQNHLNAMRNLRDSVGLQGYASRDPKALYKKQGFTLFNDMRATINTAVARTVMRMTVRADAMSQKRVLASLGQGAPRPAGAPNLLGINPTGATASALTGAIRAAAAAVANASPQPVATPEGTDGTAAAAPAPSVTQQRRALPKLGRNDACWCGSGKKYKKCHMKADYEKLGLTLPGDDSEEKSEG